jgi:hypothetical protein
MSKSSFLPCPVPVFAVDVGRADSLGWALCLPEMRGRARRANVALRGFNPLVETVATQFEKHRKIAIGFEAPLFLPVRDDIDRLTAARSGERGPRNGKIANFAWSAGAGATAALLSLPLMCLFFRQVASQLGTRPPVFFDWRAFSLVDHGIFIWEAFVVGDAKSTRSGIDGHNDDARIAVAAFLKKLATAPAGSIESDVTVPDGTVLSLPAMALLREGWQITPAQLAEQGVVVKAVPRRQPSANVRILCRIAGSLASHAINSLEREKKPKPRVR